MTSAGKTVSDFSAGVGGWAAAFPVKQAMLRKRVHEWKPARVSMDGSPEVKAGQRETKTGKYGSVPVKTFNGEEPDPATAGTDAPTKKPSWIEIELVDDKGKPVPGERYKVTLPDDSVKEGTLDDKGRARLDGCDPGTCKVTFPQLDGRSWTKE